MKTTNNYAEAFAYMVGCITARERLELPPLPAAKLLQLVYDEYGVLPVESVVKELGLVVKEEA